MGNINEDEEIRIIGGENWRSSVKETGTAGEDKGKNKRKSSRRWKLLAGALFAVAVVLLTAFYVYRQKYVYGFGYPLSRTQEEVISALSTKSTGTTVGIEKSEETILGVPMRIFHICGLRAELVTGVPDLTDPAVYLVTRNSDYWNKNNKRKIIGDYIVDGEEQSRNSWRAGYFATLGGKAEIGIGRQPGVRNFVLRHKGSMFRQLALVSGGIKCVSQYVLKGKVTRNAYARTAENELYYVETVGPETLFGFSDALIEYGFVDAIYITGGAQTDLFYRSTDGLPHGDYVDDKDHTMVVWKR